MVNFPFSDGNVRKVNDAHSILQEESDFRSGSAVNIRDPTVEKRPTGYIKYLIMTAILVVAIVLIYMFLVRPGILKATIIDIETWLKRQYEVSPLSVYTLFYLTIVSFVVFCLGFKVIIFVTATLIFQNYLISFLFILFSQLSGDFTVFLVCSFWLRSYMLKKFRNNDFFLVLLEESKSQPYMTAFITRLLFIPNGMKNYILMAIDNSPPSYFLSALIFHSFYAAEAVIIATQIKQINES